MVDNPCSPMLCHTRWALHVTDINQHQLYCWSICAWPLNPCLRILMHLCSLVCGAWHHRNISGNVSRSTKACTGLINPNPWPRFTEYRNSRSQASTPSLVSCPDSPHVWIGSDVLNKISCHMGRGRSRIWDHQSDCRRPALENCSAPVEGEGSHLQNPWQCSIINSNNMTINVL